MKWCDEKAEEEKQCQLVAAADIALSKAVLKIGRERQLQERFPPRPCRGPRCDDRAYACRRRQDRFWHEVSRAIAEAQERLGLLVGDV